MPGLLGAFGDRLPRHGSACLPCMDVPGYTGGSPDLTTSGHEPLPVVISFLLCVIAVACRESRRCRMVAHGVLRCMHPLSFCSFFRFVAHCTRRKPSGLWCHGLMHGGSLTA